jgi:hypothetical protein
MSRIPRKSIPQLPRDDDGDARKFDRIHQELALDEALMESFPASDPIAVSIDMVVYHAMPGDQSSQPKT